MQVKAMREYLKDKVETVPRSNADVEKMFNHMTNPIQPIDEQKSLNELVDEKFPRKEPTPAVEAGEIWTYVGFGVTPPHTTKYMGIQHFIRGVPTKVTDPRVLEKIGGNRSFAKGEVDMEYYFEQDEKFAKRAEEIRQEGVKMQIMIDRENRKG